MFLYKYNITIFVFKETKNTLYRRVFKKLNQPLVFARKTATCDSY